MIDVEIHNQQPYDIQTDASIFSGVESDYYDFINTNYFNIITQSSVLEIGPLLGHHSKFIIDNGPTYFEVIEGDEKSCQYLKTIPGINSVIHDDVMQNLTSSKPIDVVVCFGLLYHLHSPLHLLELIVNHCDPEYILLDCVMEQGELAFLYEKTNVPGNAQTRNGWKTCSKNLVIPFLIYLEAMKNLGYTLDLVHRVKIKDYRPKTNSWVARWKKQ
jgi:hypothetical protein